MHKTGLALAIQDTTERRRIEDALRESETRFRALAEASPRSDLASEFEGRPGASESALSGIAGQPTKASDGYRVACDGASRGFAELYAGA
jgi:PAS domain-containing protein